MRPLLPCLLALAGPAWAGVDAGLTSLTVPAPLELDRSLAYAVGLRNGGSTTSSTLVVDLHASADEVLGPGDIRLCRTQVAPLGPGAARTDTITCLWTTGIPGNHVIAEVFDAVAGVAGDDDPADNRRASGPVTPQPACAHDVQAVSLTVPPSLAPGASFTPSWSLRNHGDCDLVDLRSRLVLSADSTLDPGDTVLCDDVAAVPAAALVTRTPTCTVPAATPQVSWTVVLELDPDDALAEVDEGNNRALGATVVEVPKGPDLVVAAPTGTTSGEPGDAIDLSAQVRNDGSLSAAPTSLGVRLAPVGQAWEDGTALCTAGVPALLDGALTTVTVPGCAVPAGWPIGPARLLLRVDPFDGEAELDEANNELAVTFQVIEPPPTSGPDLEPHAVRAPTIVEVGRPFQVIYDLRNVGTTATPASTTTLALSDDDLLDGADVVVCTDGVEAFVIGQLARQIRGCVVPTGTPLGDRQLIVMADALRAIPELDETDNVVLVPLRVVAASGTNGGSGPGGSSGPGTDTSLVDTGDTGLVDTDDDRGDTDDLALPDLSRQGLGGLGCGCGTTGPSPAWVAVWSLVLLARRRRPTARPRAPAPRRG
ncbi:MAG: hypothetical protein H6732_17285 [Alphaproteobacteria bacterium]|nr:hypothetical protein [Alphaproteobacteria bacterium]